MSTDAITVGERYSSATESSNLRVTAERRGDADVLIAAGWCSDTLGASLARLRTEFDTVRAQVNGTANATVTERALILMQLKTLASTRRELGILAVRYAEHIGFSRPAPDILKLVGRALDVFLDPNCEKCDGRGSTGGGRHEQSGPMKLCGTCGNTGKRVWRVGKDDEERAFALDLLGGMEQKASRFDQELARRLRSD